ncbi:carboxynorspermidine decarboxylase [Reinekea sp.]|jgi:carboxynorspermidine decarboxylase|uniref:carboxynorspermidine decarboxylase n=1 Tax=Reinekea sp. TaxID=1970455 RepID=UPI002A7F99DF|nr:carboxynorspermidine decarboxylase [Reinekea sp.]
MQFTDFSKLDLSRLPSPCFVVDEIALERNLTILQQVADASGAKVLAALKAFSMWHFGEKTAQYLSGTCASGLHEALLGKAHYPGEVHVFSAAYSTADLTELLTFVDHVVFNSSAQWLRFQPLIQSALAARPELVFGLRINPEHSEGGVPIYDPCAPGSRLGIPLAELDQSQLAGISGLHFHTLCEQGFDALDRTLAAVEQKFGHLLTHMSWVNFGGGHHITAPGYNVDGLVKRIRAFKEKYQLEVYLEPGEAIAIGTGVLVSEVLDLTFNQLPQAILDTSATCHMPDTLEMPYRADVLSAGCADEKAHTYRLGGMTCLAGDVIGDYSFDRPLQLGQRLIFEDMAHYTMVKTSTFNGTRLPALAVWNSVTDQLEVVKEFSFDDFKNRLS